MQYKATAKYLRISPRKVRLVADGIRNLSPASALTKLALVPNRGAESLLNVLKSVIASAQAKTVQVDKLQFLRIEVMGGPVLKRWHAVSRGSAHSFKKRMTHIQIVLTDEITETKSQLVKGVKKMSA